MKYDKAVDAIEFGITHDPKPRWWFFDIAFDAYNAAGRLPELVQLAEVWAGKETKYKKWWLELLARAYFYTNQRDKAKELWKQISKVPDPPEQ
jgi:hypothetical protein